MCHETGTRCHQRTSYVDVYPVPSLKHQPARTGSADPFALDLHFYVPKNHEQYSRIIYSEPLADGKGAKEPGESLYPFNWGEIWSYQECSKEVVGL